MGMGRDCRAEHSRSLGASGMWFLRGDVAKRYTEEVGRTDLFDDKVSKDGPRRGAQSFLDVMSCFMRQR